MRVDSSHADGAQRELANRIFFALYRCSNLMHKTGTRAVSEFQMTTQNWAILGALSRPEAETGMSVGELASYLGVTRQNLTVVVRRLESQGHLERAVGAQDKRSRRIRLTSSGRALWQRNLLPAIHTYYDEALEGFSFNDEIGLLHNLNRLFQNLSALDATHGGDNR
jgi:DNA-binding MarR family transcriptional regulator